MPFITQRGERYIVSDDLPDNLKELYSEYVKLCIARMHKGEKYPPYPIEETKEEIKEGIISEKDGIYSSVSKLPEEDVNALLRKILNKKEVENIIQKDLPYKHTILSARLCIEGMKYAAYLSNPTRGAEMGLQ